MGIITWRGIRSDDIGVEVERFPAHNGPARRYETAQVPGRNGALLYDLGAWDNYTQAYAIYARQGTAADSARRLRDWLCSVPGYHRLEDTYDPDFYRLAYYAGPTITENIWNTHNRATIEFVCKPQRWSKAGETAVTLEEAGTLENPYNQTALPLVRVNGTGGGTLTIGGAVVEIADIDDYVILDSALPDAYKDGVNKNGDITLTTGIWPELGTGENTVSWTGDITSVKTTPRWWTI